MKVLIIQVGNFALDDQLSKGVIYYKFPTLLFGEKRFDQPQVINNVQTRKSIENDGHEVVFYFHTHRKKLRDLILSSIKIRQLSKEIRPDITHIYWGGISGLMAALFVKGKSIVSLLGSDLYGSYQSNGSRVKSSIIQSICSQCIPVVASQVIVMSDRMKRYMWPLATKRINVVPEGISLDKFYPLDKLESRSILGWDQDKFVILFFYQGQGVKNIALAQEAIRILSKKIKNVEMKLIKGINHDDLNPLYNAADCLLMTSFHEGSNNSIKEAMACNLPVVSVTCGDAEERLSCVINSHVCGYDANDLSAALYETYLSNDRSNGRTYVDQVSLEYCGRELINIYKNVTNS